MPASPVFIHALFRTGSTYIWNKFRQLPRFVCYYEPFHQLLGGITPENIKDTLTRNFKAAGHPELDRHYLYEYEALLRPDTPGVPYFRKELSFDWFCQAGGEPHPEQKSYVDFLIRAAGKQIPLFQFNRTALRSGWFRSAYPGSLNIYLYRNPRDQWQSYVAIQARTGFDAFFIMDIVALSKNREHALIRPLDGAVPLLEFHSAAYAQEEAFYRALYRVYGEKEKYFIFYYLWLTALGENAGHADLLWDINRLADDAAYRGEVQRTLAQRCGAVIDFSDCRITRYSAYSLPGDVMDGIEAEVQDLVGATLAKDRWREISGPLPPEIKSLLGRRRAGLFGAGSRTRSGSAQPERSKISEQLARQLFADWLKNEAELKRLGGKLREKNDELARCASQLAQDALEAEKQRQEIEELKGLGGQLREKNDELAHCASQLAQDALEAEKQRREIEELKGLRSQLRDKNDELARCASQLAQDALEAEKQRQEIEELKGLGGQLRDKNDELERYASQLAQDAIEAERGKRELEALQDALAEKSRMLERLQDAVKKQEQELEALNVALAEKDTTLALLQAKLSILMRSYSFRLGRVLLSPLRLCQRYYREVKSVSLSRGAPGIEPGTRSPGGKISVSGQIQLNFGRHRSGLKYGLNFLLDLHHPGGVDLDAFIERTFSWHPERNFFYSKPWIGFIHVPPRIPEWFQPHVSNAAIFRSETWQKSLPHCRGLFTFSRYHQEHLQKLLPLPIDVLRLPSETPALTWSWESFESNRQKKLVQVGWWLRRLHAIFQFPPTPFQKIFLNVEHPSLPELMEKERALLIRQGLFRDVDVDSVTTIPFLPDNEYDRLLSRNIAFMFLYDSSACNAIVECMVRRTPLLINPLEAVVEYLGEDYPFYFESLDEAATKLMNPDLIRRTHEYLCRLPRVQELSGENFLRAFAGSGIYRTLPVPAERMQG